MNNFKKYRLIIASLVLLAVFNIVSAQEQVEQTKPLVVTTLKENSIIGYFDAEGQFVNSKEQSKYYRKLLKINDDDSLIIQDFYTASDKKQMDPTTFKNIKDIDSFIMEQIGTINGKYVEWYENGQKSMEVNYVEGKYTGIATEWYENGQKKFEASNNKNKFEVILKSWYKNGQLESECLVKNNILQTGCKHWNQQGDLVE